MGKNNIKSAIIYIPCLFKFNNDQVSINTNLMKKIKTNIKSMNGVSFDSSKKEYQFSVDLAKCIFNKKGNNNYKKFQSNHIQSYNIKFYYYHHRMIFKYEIEYEHNDSDIKFPSSIRTIITENHQILMEMIIEKINAAVAISKSNKSKKTYDEIIFMYYSYPIIMQVEQENLSNWLETMTHRITLPKGNGFKETSPIFRLSIPSLIIINDEKLSYTHTANIINTVYQSILYRVKEDSKYNGQRYSKLQTTLLVTNQIREKNLIKMSKDFYASVSKDYTFLQTTIFKKTLYFAIASTIAAIISIIMTILLR